MKNSDEREEVTGQQARNHRKEQTRSAVLCESTVIVVWQRRAGWGKMLLCVINLQGKWKRAAVSLSCGLHHWPPVCFVQIKYGTKPGNHITKIGTRPAFSEEMYSKGETETNIYKN